MFGLFKRKSEKAKLETEYDNLLEESYRLSHTNRTASDKKRAEAQEVLLRIEEIERSNSS